MAEIDSLEIKIESEAKSALSSLDNLVGKLGEISESIKGIQSQTIKINFDINNGATKELDKIGKYVDSASDKMAKRLSEAFNINTSGIKEIESVTKELGGNIRDYLDGKNGAGDYQKSMELLTMKLIDAASNARYADEEMKRFYNTLLNISKIKINPQDITGEDWKDIDGALRGKLNYKEGTPLDTLMSEWRKNFSGIFDGIEKEFNLDNVNDQVQALNRILKQCREGIEAPVSGGILEDSAWENVLSETRKLYDDIKNVNTVLKESGAATEKVSNTGGIKEIANALKTLTGIDAGKLSNISSSLGALTKSVSEMNGVTFNSAAILQVANAMKRFEKIGSSIPKGSFDSFSSQIQNFVRQLNGIGSLSFDTSGLSSFVNIISRLGGKSVTNAVANISTISAQLQNLVRQMNNIGSLSFDTSSLVALISAISRLGGKSVTNAVANLPPLAAALRDLIQTLANAPVVSNNVTNLVNSLANLAAQGGRVGSASTSMVNGINNASDSMKRARKNSIGLASSLGKLYAKWFLVVRGIKSFMNSVESTTDYIEAFNYYNVAFGKIAKEWKNDFKKYGYENARSYAESFTKRMDESFKKFSGLYADLNDDLLEETRLKNLGLNIQEVTQYASQLASVTNSIGQTGEVSLAAAKSMTMLAGDISSLFNIDFNSVSENLQSGLIGQSRALYKYGIDITNATLANYAYSLGIEKSISEMTQAEKMQLRMIAILDQSKVSWGDLANTINSPSNMLRQFTNNVKELSMVFGQLFIPILQKVMPIINGVTIALKRLFVSFAQILGIKIDFDAFGQGYSGIEDGLDDMADGFDDVTKSVKKAVAGIRAFDELKVINTPDDSQNGTGSGGDVIDLTDEILKATDEYERVWNTAFENMQNTAQEWADRIEKILEPVKKIFKDFAVGDFFSAGKDTSKLVKSIFNFFKKAIKGVDWNKIGKQVGKFLRGIDWYGIFKSLLGVIGEALQAVLSFYFGMLTSAPLETALITALALPGALEAISSSKIISGIKNLWNNFGIWGEKLELVVGALSGNEAAMSRLFMLYPELGDKVKGLKDAFSGLKDSLAQKGLWGTVNEGIETFRNNLGLIPKLIIAAGASYIEFNAVQEAIENLITGTGGFLSEIGKIAGAVGLASAAMYVALGPAGLALGAIVGIAGAIKGINDAFKSIEAEEAGRIIRNAMEIPGGVPIGDLAENIRNALINAASGFDTISEKSAEMDSVQNNIKDTWLEIYKIQEAMENGVISVEEGKEKLSTLFSELATLTEQKFSAMNTVIMSAYGENGSFRAALEKLGADTEEAIDTMITYGYQNSEKAKEIAKELTAVDINSEDYKRLTQELASLTGEMSRFEQATSDFTYDMNSLQGKIDYSKIFLEDGSIDTEALKKYLESAKEALNEYNSSIDEAAKELSKSWNEILGSASATEEQKAIAKTQLDYIPQAVEQMKNDAALQVVSFTDMIQNDFIGRTSQIIDDSIAEWESKGTMTKLFGKIFGSGNESEYVDRVLQDHQENIDKLSDTIEESLSDLGIKGTGWGSEVSEKIFDSLFDHEKAKGIWSGSKVGKLNDQYRSVIEEATSGIAALAEERGKNGAEGYAIGLEDKTALNSAKKAASGLALAAVAAIAEAQDSHSPSKATEELGKYAVEGYAKGISENTDISESAISEWTGNISEMFSEWRGATKEEFSGWGKEISETFSEWSDNSAEAISGWREKAEAEINAFTETSDKIGEWSEKTFYSVDNWSSRTKEKIENWSNDIQGIVSGWTQSSTDGMNEWKENTMGIMELWYRGMSVYLSKESWSFNGINEGLSASFNSAINSVKRAWNSFAEWLNKKLEIDIKPIKIEGEQIFGGAKINLGKIPAFATGGFPEDGWFRASHGEIMGKFDNGQSVVANNSQITQGIADAVYPAVYNAVSSAMRNSTQSGQGAGDIRVYVGNSQLTDVVIEGINEKTRKSGRTPIDLAF